MLFFSPHPTYWDDPSGYPSSGWRRWLWSFGNDFFNVNPKWLVNWNNYYQRLEREQEAYQMWIDQQAEYDLMIQMYTEHADYLSGLLPRSLHQMGLSYVRTMRDRKGDRPYQKIDYCVVEDHYFDEYAFYFWIATWPPFFPRGVTIDRSYE